jgi:adenylylsulfate kinase
VKGVYILAISINREARVKIGSLGTKHFEKGLYVYVGSAQQNLEKRILRHIKRDKRKFWHIDYLLGNESVKIFDIFYKDTGKAFECKFAEKLGEIGVPINGFGSSDCKCQSHLFKVNTYESLREALCANNFREVSILRDGWCVWVTGLPGSGKSVVSKALLNLLEKEGIHAQLLSSDSLRRVMTPKPKYNLDERDAVYATLVYVAKLLTKNGVNVVIDATGNLRRYRENARAQIPKFIEAYLECPLEICMRRESKRTETHLAPKKIYEKALKGKAPTVPGIGQPYEEPLNPEVRVDAARLSPEECAKKIMSVVERYYRA